MAQQATARRQNRDAGAARQIALTAAQIREEAEIAQAIQRVADLIQEEEERAIAAAEAHALREEAERIAREEEERVMEESRIEAINLRFRGFTAELETLHDVQRVLIAQRYDSESLRMKNERQDALFSIFCSAPTRDPGPGNATTMKLSEAVHKFEEQYKARLAEEHRIEEEYTADLRAFWEGKPDGEYMIRGARDELRETHCKEYKLWDAHRKEQVAAISEAGKRKMVSLRTKQKAEVNEVEGRSRLDEVDFKGKVAAEGIWVQEVGRQRIIILQQMEQAEYARTEA